MCRKESTQFYAEFFNDAKIDSENTKVVKNLIDNSGTLLIGALVLRH